MIEVKQLHKRFGRKSVLTGIDFSVNRGESLAIIGKSGSGKSVLLKHLIGLLKPDSGEVWFDGKLVNKMSFRELQNIRSKVGMVFQFGALFDSMSVSENISLALKKLTKLNNHQISERIHKSLIDVGLVDTKDLMPSELSGGMKKRVGLARAIAIQPEFLFYDEPTTGLDPIMTDIINRLIIKFQMDKEITSIIVTHEMRTVKDVSDRVIMLHDGEIHFDGSPTEIQNSKDIYVRQFITGDSTLKQKEKV